MRKTVAIDIGNKVVCDICDCDYTECDDEGGFMFESKAVCPNCSAMFMEGVTKYHEEQYIRSVANPGESFRDFVLRMRNGNNVISISGRSSDVEYMAKYIRTRFGDDL